MSVLLEKRAERRRGRHARPAAGAQRARRAGEGAAWATSGRRLRTIATCASTVLTGAGEKAFCAGSDIKEINRTGRMVTTEIADARHSRRRRAAATSR